MARRRSSSISALSTGELLALGLERACLDVPERLQLRRFKLLRHHINRVGTRPFAFASEGEGLTR